MNEFEEHLDLFGACVLANRDKVVIYEQMLGNDGFLDIKNHGIFRYTFVAVADPNGNLMFTKDYKDNRTSYDSISYGTLENDLKLESNMIFVDYDKYDKFGDCPRSELDAKIGLSSRLVLDHLWKHSRTKLQTFLVSKPEPFSN